MIGVIFDRNIGRLIFLLKKVTKQLKIKGAIHKWGGYLISDVRK